MRGAASTPTRGVMPEAMKAEATELLEEKYIEEASESEDKRR